MQYLKNIQKMNIIWLSGVKHHVPHQIAHLFEYTLFPDKSKNHVKQVTRHHIPINSYELLLKHVKTYNYMKLHFFALQ
jgi:hypothetical protein